MSEQPERLLSVEEFAACIGRSARTVFRYVSQGRLKSVTVTDIGRNAVRIPESETVRFAGDPLPAHDSRRQTMAANDAEHAFASGSRRQTLTAAASERAFDDGSQWQSQPSSSMPAPGLEIVDAVSDEVAVSDSHSPSPMTVTVTEVRPEPGHITAQDILGRYEAAVMRIGYIEGELSVTRRMLGDGGTRESELRQRITAAEQEAYEEATARKKAEDEAEALRQKLADVEAERQALQQTMQQPFWRRWFR